MLITDKISMVSNVLLFKLSHRLTDIFGCDSKKSFAGLPLIVCGDFYQLPPANGALFNQSNHERLSIFQHLAII